MSTKSKVPVGASLIVLSSFFYASYGIWTKLMGDFFEGYTASALRSVLVVLLLLPAAFMVRHFEPLQLSKNWKYMLGMFVGSLFTWGPLYYAVQNAGVGISLAINYASMIIALFFLGWLFVRERFTRDKAVSAVLGIIGLAFIFSPSAEKLGAFALICAAISGVSVALTMICSKQQTYNATQSTLVLWTISIVANAIMAAALRESQPAIGLYIEWVYLLCFGVASVVASWCLIRGMKLIEAGAAGILGLLEIVFGLLFGVLFFHERPAVIALLGMVVIIAAAAIPYVKDYNARRGTLD